MAGTWVDVQNEVMNEEGLCFQRGVWHWDDGSPPSEGYRFIWRDENTGNLKPSRGQAYISDAATMLDLMARAMRDGWLR
jgi:hypothetical protein